MELLRRETALRKREEELKRKEVELLEKQNELLQREIENEALEQSETISTTEDFETKQEPSDETFDANVKLEIAPSIGI